MRPSGEESGGGSVFRGSAWPSTSFGLLGSDAGPLESPGPIAYREPAVAAAKIITVVFVAVLINIVVVNDDGARGLTREAVEAKCKKKVKYNLI